MTALDNTLPAVAVELVNEFGVAASVSRVLRSYDAQTGREHEDTEAMACKALAPTVVSSKSSAGGIVSNQPITYIAGPALTSAPQPGDALTISGRAWMIQAVTAIRSGDLVALYQLELAAP